MVCSVGLVWMVLDFCSTWHKNCCFIDTSDGTRIIFPMEHGLMIQELFVRLVSEDDSCYPEQLRVQFVFELHRVVSI